MIEKFTKNPAEGLRRKDLGHLSVGANADITIIDPNIKYKINVENFLSKGKNSPFNDREVTGKVLYTLVNGKIIVENGNLREEYK